MTKSPTPQPNHFLEAKGSAIANRKIHLSLESMSAVSHPAWKWAKEYAVLSARWWALQSVRLQEWLSARILARRWTPLWALL